VEKRLVNQLLEICNEDELLKAMKSTPLKKGYIRLNVIYLLINGVPRKTVFKLTQKSRKTFYTWIRRYLKYGIDGLINKPKSGRPSILQSKTVKDKLIKILDDPNIDNEGLYTAVKIYSHLKKEFEVEFSYSSLLRYIHKEDYNLRIPRRIPNGGDEESRKAFKIKLELLSSNDSNEIWFEDESGFEGDPRPKRKWTKRGKKSKLNYEGLHIRQNVLGAICPKTGELISILFDYCDTESFQALLDEIAKQTLDRSKNKNIILILDNVSWHKTKALNWHHIKPEYLSPYSPDFNPIERLWLRIKADFFANFISKTPEELTNRICEAILYYVENSQKIISLCKIG
jgi:transposase